MFEQMPPKQLRILELVSQGYLTREIGAEMGFTEQYIKNMLTRIYRALGVRNAAAATAMYVKWMLRK